MSINDIQQNFTSDVLKQINVIPNGNDSFYISTRFFFDDGDEFIIYLKHRDGKWMLSDDGHTYVYLSYTLEPKDIHKGIRGKTIRRVLNMFNIEDKNGELVLDLSSDRYVGRYGEALHNFIQAISKISSVLYWLQHQPKRTFKEQSSDRLGEILGKSRIEMDWHDEENDPKKQYTVDCRVNGLPSPLFIYAISNTTKIRDAVIAWRWFDSMDISFTPYGIIKEEKLINSKLFTRMQDVCEFYDVGINNSIQTIKRLSNPPPQTQL